ncbi:MAG: FAD:protein FMN transferase [Phycisphaerales bacterium]|jgi:thiamine biosynthesis lipoprotein
MKTKIRYITIAVFFACLLAILYLSINTQKPVALNSGYHLVMGTFARVVAIAEDSSTAQKCIDAAFAQINKVDDLMSDYKSDSEISLVNKNGFNKPVQVSRETYEVLKKSLEFSRLTDGAFDITVGPLVDLFHTAEQNGIFPDKEQVEQAKSKVGYEKLKLDDQNRTIRFTVEGMRLDLGAIAKGYAADKAIEAMQNAGAIGGMVDLGGDIRCFGSPSKGKKNWLIGLQNPNTEQDTTGRYVLLKLKLIEGAVATSGDYQQYILIEGKRQSHIMDRKTGTSAEGLSSVTIIADNATDADALATAVSVVGTEKGLALIEKLPHTEAILIASTPEYKLTKTTGAEKYIVKE